MTPLLEELSGAAEDGARRSRGFLARWFGARSAAAPEPDARTRQTLDRLAQLAAAAADGYAMSLRRAERILTALQLEPLACVGERFDPETMEAIEVSGDSGYPSGIVAEEVRPGYRWRGKAFRFAQVKVAR